MSDLQNSDSPTLKERLFGKPSVFKAGYKIPGLDGLKMDGECVRTRSTLLHMFSWSAMIHIFFIDEDNGGKEQKDMWFLMLYVGPGFHSCGDGRGVGLLWCESPRLLRWLLSSVEVLCHCK